MSKPGGKPIVKERPFFEDENFAVFGKIEEGKITRWVFVNKTTNTRKEFPVKDNLIKKAFQELEKHADQVTANLLGKIGAKIKGPTPPKVKRLKQYNRKQV